MSNVVSTSTKYPPRDDESKEYVQVLRPTELIQEYVDSKEALCSRSEVSETGPGSPPPSSLPSSQLQKYAEDQYTDILAGRLLSLAAGSERKHNLLGIQFATVRSDPVYSTTPGIFNPLNGPAQGVTVQSRLGNEIRCHHLTMRIKGFIDNTQPFTNASGGLPFGVPRTIRHIIFWDKFPTSISAIAPTDLVDTNPSTDVNAVGWTAGLGEVAAPIMVKNLVTNSRYEVIYDEHYNWENYQYSISWTPSGTVCTHAISGSFHKVLQIPLHGRKTFFSNQNANSFVSGALINMFISDCPAGETFALPVVRWLSDLTFLDPQ